MLSCPYSLSLFGGVQGQVLGLARALRELGVDARDHRPVRRPAARARHHQRRSRARGCPSNGSVAPIATGRAVARRTLEALRTFRARRAAPARAARRPGANHAALVGTDAAGGRHLPLRRDRDATAGTTTFRPALRPMMRRLAVRDRGVGRRAAPGRRSRSAPTARSCPTASTSSATRRRARGRRADRPRSCSSAATSRARASRCCSTRSRGLDRDAVLWVVGRRARRPRRCAARASPNVEWLGRVGEEEKASRLARRDRRLLPGDRRRVVRRGAARGDGGRHRGRRVRHRRLPHRGARRPRGAARAARRRRRACAPRCARVLDDAAHRRARSSPRAGRGPPSSR